MENEGRTCLHCGNGFSSVRADAKFCSSACRKAHARLEAKHPNQMLAGELIRGQHKGDVPVTGHGVEQGRCLCCRKVFKRWIPSKLARLVRNEMEGLTWGTARELDRDRFDLMMAERMLEVKFCDDACQEKGPMPWPEWLRLDAAELEQRETKMERTTQEPQQEKSNGQHKSQPKHRGQR